MSCDEFIKTITNFQPTDLSQVERIRLVEHTQECEKCFAAINVDIPELDYSVKELAEMDKKVLD